MSKKKKTFIENRAFQDFIKCLISHDRFSEKVLEIRKKFDIPKFGFKEEDDIKSFYEGLIEKSDDMCDAKNLPLNDGREPIVMFNRMRSDLMKDFKLPPHLDRFLLLYILTNKIKAPNSNFTVSYSSKKEAPPCVTIVAYSKLSNQDLNQIKFLVNLNDNLKTLKSSPRLSRNLKIEGAYREYRNMDKDYGDEPMTQSELAKNYLKSKKKNKQVSDIINDLNKKRKKLFG